MSPALLHVLGGCVDKEGNPPKAPFAYDLTLQTDEDTSQPWTPGETRTLNLVRRSSSLRWFVEPPRVEMLLMGRGGNDILIGGHGRDKLRTANQIAVSPVQGEGKMILDGTSNTIGFTVPEVPSGPYRIYVFERSTGLCKASDFTFRIDGGESRETPTPTPTEVLPPTPTQMPGGPTPTRTLRMPDYDGSRFVNAVDLPAFRRRLRMLSEEADLDGEGRQNYRDLFMFSLWWQRSQLRDR